MNTEKDPAAVALPPREPGTLIYRQVTFEPVTFDHLKAHQRRLESAHSRDFTIAQTLRALILAHGMPK